MASTIALHDSSAINGTLGATIRLWANPDYVGFFLCVRRVTGKSMWAVELWGKSRQHARVRSQIGDNKTRNYRLQLVRSLVALPYLLTAMQHYRLQLTPSTCQLAVDLPLLLCAENNGLHSLRRRTSVQQAEPEETEQVGTSTSSAAAF